MASAALYKLLQDAPTPSNLRPGSYAALSAWPSPSLEINDGPPDAIVDKTRPIQSNNDQVAFAWMVTLLRRRRASSVEGERLCCATL